MQIYAWKKVSGQQIAIEIALEKAYDNSNGWILNVGKVRYYNVMQSNTLPTQNVLLEKKKKKLNQHLCDSV